MNRTTDSAPSRNSMRQSWRLRSGSLLRLLGSAKCSAQAIEGPLFSRKEITASLFKCSFYQAEFVKQQAGQPWVGNQAARSGDQNIKIHRHIGNAHAGAGPVV